jgi:hypothetical protein
MRIREDTTKTTIKGLSFSKFPPIVPKKNKAIAGIKNTIPRRPKFPFLIKFFIFIDFFVYTT